MSIESRVKNLEMEIKILKILCCLKGNIIVQSRNKKLLEKLKKSSEKYINENLKEKDHKEALKILNNFFKMIQYDINQEKKNYQ